MDKATRFVLGRDATIPIDMKVFRDRFEDEDGLPMFQRVMRLLGKCSKMPPEDAA